MKCIDILRKLQAWLTALVVAMFIVASADVSAKEFVVVIDAGHGGHDAGALGGSSKEKDIALSVAKKMAATFKDQQEDVKVVMTRSTDVFVTLDGRVRKGKEANADLFISIHCNSAAKNRQTVSGTEVWILGPDAADANLDLAIRENQSILLEKDHSTRYAGFDNSPEYYIFNEISQNRMQGKSNVVAGYILNELVGSCGLKNRGLQQTSKLFLLLHATVPSVLVELDFICNPSREKYLTSEANQQKLAQAICNGVAKFRGSKPSKKAPKAEEREEEQIDTALPDSDDKKETVKEDRKKDTKKDKEKTKNELVYCIQFMTSPTKLKDGAKQLKGVKDATYYRDGSTYKYIYGRYSSQSDAQKDLKTIRKKFPDAFLIKMQGGKRIK